MSKKYLKLPKNFNFIYSKKNFVQLLKINLQKK